MSHYCFFLLVKFGRRRLNECTGEKAGEVKLLRSFQRTILKVNSLFPGAGGDTCGQVHRICQTRQPSSQTPFLFFFISTYNRIIRTYLMWAATDDNCYRYIVPSHHLSTITCTAYDVSTPWPWSHVSSSIFMHVQGRKEGRRPAVGLCFPQLL